MHAVEQHRRRRIEEEEKHQHADEQHERLQRNLPVRAHEQRFTRRIHRGRRQVSLHLALIRSEVRAEEKQRGNRAGPERVLVREVEREVERLQSPCGAGDAQRRQQPDVIRQPGDQHDDRRDETEDDEHHLLHVGPGHRLHAAEHRVDRRRHSDQQHRRRQVSAQHDRQDDGRRRDHDAERHAARQQEQQARERSRLRVEPALEIFVGRVDLGVVEERYERDREDDHRDRQREVELQEAHAVRVSLPRRSHHRDRAELRRHHRQPDRPPRQAAAAEEITLELMASLGQSKAVPDDPDQIEGDDRPVDGRHENSSWKM